MRALWLYIEPHYDTRVVLLLRWYLRTIRHDRRC